MGEIFQKAALVLAWLGPAADERDRVMGCLSELGLALLRMPDGPCLEERRELFSRLLSPEAKPAFPLKAVFSLFRRSW